MGEKSKAEKYVDYINIHILPFVDYSKLQTSYDTDMTYAKGILNRLHEAMVTVYGSDRLDESMGDDGFVVIPGIVRGRDGGKICIALLDLDLSSSGEHWGTSFLCKYGVIAQSGLGVANNNGDVVKSEIAEICGAYLPYDYCYTAKIPCDIHVSASQMPEELNAVLNDFRNHKAVLQFEHEKVQKCDKGTEKPSTLEQIREAAKSPKEPKKGRQTKNKREPEL